MSIRKISPLLCLAFAASLAACGSSDSGGTTTDDTGSTPADTSVADGTATDSGTNTDAATDTTTTKTDTTSTTDGTGTDTASSGDTSGVTCGSATCKTGEVCCVTPKDGGADQVCATSCSDGGVALGCDGPEDCPSLSSNICCATLKVGAGSPPSCPFESGAAACAATCPTKIPTGCPGEGKVRLCHAKADCAGDPSNTECCTFSGGGSSATFCISSTLAAFAPGGCAP